MATTYIEVNGRKIPESELTPRQQLGVWLVGLGSRLLGVPKPKSFSVGHEAAPAWAALQAYSGGVGGTGGSVRLFTTKEAAIAFVKSEIATLDEDDEREWDHRVFERDGAPLLDAVTWTLRDGRDYEEEWTVSRHHIEAQVHT